MAEFLRARPLLMLFVVAALGCLFGRLRAWGFSLGVAAVLFAGLFVGWWIPGIQLPDFVAQLGLVLFIYTLGLASGPTFFASLVCGAWGQPPAWGSWGCVPWARLVSRACSDWVEPDRESFRGALTNTPRSQRSWKGSAAAGVSGAALAAPVIACSIWLSARRPFAARGGRSAIAGSRCLAKGSRAPASTSRLKPHRQRDRRGAACTAHDRTRVEEDAGICRQFRAHSAGRPDQHRCTTILNSQWRSGDADWFAERRAGGRARWARCRRRISNGIARKWTFDACSSRTRSSPNDPSVSSTSIEVR